jgi:hypothetical protein
VRSVVVLAVLAVLAGTATAGPLHDQPPAHDVVAALPASVPKPANVVSLFADPTTAAGDRIELFLVNLTSATVGVPAQDHDLYAKLEIDASGTWKRAQSHAYSDCGNSYHVIDLAPGEFLHWSEYHPAKGTAAKTRYRLYGTLNVVSNPLPGAFDAAELAAAARDALAMRDGQIPALTAVLFAPAHDRQARELAIERLGQLPAASAVPVVEQLLGTALDDSEYSHAIRVLDHLAPPRFAALVTALVKGAQSAARDRLVHELPYAPHLTDPALQAELIARTRDPKSPDLDPLLDTVAAWKTPDAEAALTAIASDAHYADEVRQRARYLREEWFGGAGGLTIRLAVHGNYSDGHPPPVAIDVTLENTSTRPIPLAYSAPTELVALYVTRAHGREQTFLPAKPTAKFFAPPSAHPATQLVLAPGQSHTIRLGVMNYFDLQGGGLTVWASVKLPGSAVGQLGGGGIGISPRP